jgi:hypothetical protein
VQQSNFIFGALAVAFVVFITTRGSLPTYMSVLFGTASAPSSSEGASGSASDLGGMAQGVIGGAVKGAIGGLLQ